MITLKVGDLLYWPATARLKRAARLGMVRELNVGIANNVYVYYIPENDGFVSKVNAAIAKKDLDKLREAW